MADVFDSKKRSEIMRSVRSSGNKSTELTLISFFDEHGIKGWRRHYPIKGHPDFVFLKPKIAIFVDGCFWHGHNCRNTTPNDNDEYWRTKRLKNQIHDQEVNSLFTKRGWIVIRIWECELKKKNWTTLFTKLAPIFRINQNANSTGLK